MTHFLFYGGHKKNTKEKIGRHLSEEFEVNVRVHQGSALLPLLFAISVDVVTSEIKEGISKIYCT